MYRPFEPIILYIKVVVRGLHYMDMLASSLMSLESFS